MSPTLDESRAEFGRAGYATVDLNGHGPGFNALCPTCPAELTVRPTEDGDDVVLECPNGCTRERIGTELAMKGRSKFAAVPDDSEAARHELGEILGLHEIGMSVRGARVVGTGSRASADVYIDGGGDHLYFEHLRDVANPTRLTLEVVACTGATPAIKLPKAMRVVALLRAISEREATMTADQVAIDWGTSFLQSAAVREVDMNDQAARWDSFCALERMDPIALARQAGAINVAQASVVLRDSDGSRLVRCGWFTSYARREDPSASPQEVAHRMQRVGWERRGKAGRIKASQPGHGGRLLWTFYTVPEGWEADR